MKYKNFFFLPVGLATCCFFTLISSFFFTGLLCIFFLILLLYRRQWGLILITVALVTLFLIRYHMTQVTLKQDIPVSGQLSIYPDTIALSGDQVTFDGELSTHKTKFRYRLKTKEEKMLWQDRNTRYLELTFTGAFTSIMPSTNQHGFDYFAYLKSEHYQGVVQIDQITAERALDRWTFPLHYLRMRAIFHTEKHLPSTTALWLNGLLFNYRQSEYYEFLTTFTQNGLLHLFSISGLHVYFFLGWLDFFFRRLGFTAKSQLPFFLLASVVLAGLFGGSISILRAVLAYLSYWFVKEFPLKFSATDRYALVLMICLVIEPQALQQLSAQLSFLFSFFLLFLRPSATTIKARLYAAYLFPILSIPMLLYQFYDWPIASGIWTFFLVPYFELFLLPSAVLLFLIASIEPISHPLAYALTSSLQVVDWLITCFPFLKWYAGALPIFWAISCTIAALWAITKKRIFLFLLASAGVPLIVTSIHPFEKITFLDVGQGDTTVIQSRGNREIYLIDTGGKLSFQTEAWKQTKPKVNATYSVIPYLKGEGIHTITGLFLTHGDTDHMGDAASLLSQFHVQTLFLAKGSQDHPNIKRLLRAFPHQRVELLTVDQVIGERFTIHVLSPLQLSKGENNDSLVLYTTIAKQRVLLTGDLEKSGELDLLKRYPSLSVDLLKIGHHGSKTSTDPTFVAAIQPKVAIISVGRNNRYHHPHQETLHVLDQEQIKTLRTDQRGMIQYRSFGPFIKQIQGLDD